MKIDIRGFTLPELLMVVALVGTLAAFLMSALGGARETAGDTECMANLRSLHAAATTFASDNDGKFPDRHWWLATGSAGSLIRYLNLPSNSGKPTGLTCPVDHAKLPAMGEFFATYSINTYTTGSHHGKPDVYERMLTVNQPATSFQTCFTPSQTAMFMDGARNSLGGTGPSANETKIDDASPLQFPHRDSMNVVYVDGHVSKISKAYALHNLTKATSPNPSPFWGAILK